MGTISERTAAASGEASAGDLSCSRHQPARTGTLAGLAHCHPKAARWDRTPCLDRGTSRGIKALGREYANIEPHPDGDGGTPADSGRPQTVDFPAVDPIPLFAPKPKAYVLGSRPYAAGINLAEKFIYGILAGGAVLAVSGGLSWTGELVGHWATFSAGIDKLLH